MSFKKFLTEATFKSSDIPEVVSKVANIISQRLGQQFYPYNKNGLQEFVVEGKTYQCYLYFMESLKAVRFNTFNGTFDSIEVWDRYKLDSPSDYTIRLDGMNINKIVESLADLVANPSHGTHKLSISEEFLTESRTSDIAQQMGLEYFGFGKYGSKGRVTHEVQGDRLVPFEANEKEDIVRMKHVKNPNDFHLMAIKTFGDSKPLSRLSWSDVEFLAAKNGVRIPGWVRNSGSGKGKNKVFSVVPNKALAPDAEEPETLKQSGEKKGTDYFVKVSPRDSVTNKFGSAKTDPEAQRMTALIDAALNSPSTNAMEQEMKDPDTMFGHMSDLCKLVVKGVSPSLFIYGGPGTGKTFVVGKTLKDAGLVPNKDYFVVKGKITPVALYQMLYIHRNDKTMLVFDDADSAFANEDAANILKAALDSYDEREISWSSNRTRNVDKWSDAQRNKYEASIDAKLKPDEDEEDKSEKSDEPPSEDDEKKVNKADTVVKLPNKFKFDGKIIFISNLPKSRVDDAVLSRSYKIDMTLTPNQMFKRMDSLLDKVEPGVDMDLKKKVLATIKANYQIGKLEYPNMRTLVSAISIANSGLPNWADLLEYT